VVIIIDEAQNLSPESLETVRLLTNLETSKEKLLQVVLLGQPELRELLQRRSLRQLAQRITARFHLTPLGPTETPLYVRHRMQVAGAQRNPFRRGAMKALHQRSHGIPRLINIIADRALAAAYAAEKGDVDASMVHAAANEVQLGEQRVRLSRWPWLAGAAGLAAIAALLLLNVDSLSLPGTRDSRPPAAATAAQADAAQAPDPATAAPGQPGKDTAPVVAAPVLDTAWLNEHQRHVWQDYATLWDDKAAATAIQAACDGNGSLGYACVREQGSWSKIRRLNLPVVLQLEGDSRSNLLLLGMDTERLLVGDPSQPLTIARQAVDAVWLGSYLAAWPQAPDWPATVSRGDSGPAVKTIMEMAARVQLPYHGGQLFDAEFERWLKGFQLRNGLQVDGIVGRNTLLHLMTASIQEPHLLQNWD
jgi:general secretion pathway protein A